jgi:hypothetical protein
MKLKQSILNFRTSLIKGGIFYLKSFYYPSFYRDEVYRQEGYGLKNLFLVFLGLMFISYVLIASQVIHQYETLYQSQLKTLPNLSIENHKLNNFNQSLSSSGLINHKYFLWLGDELMQDMNLLSPNEHRIILNPKFLWLPYPGSNYFAYGFSNLGHFLPVLAWASFKDFVNGEILIEKLHGSNILMMFFLLSIPIYCINCFFIFIFVRLFSYIGKNMVLLALKEPLDYKLTCRLLSLSGIPTMTYMALIIDVWGINFYTKYVFVLLSMLNFYIGLRLIKTKSYFRWMSV